jgi:hypothetical protein
MHRQQFCSSVQRRRWQRCPLLNFDRLVPSRYSYSIATFKGIWRSTRFPSSALWSLHASPRPIAFKGLIASQSSTCSSLISSRSPMPRLKWRHRYRPSQVTPREPDLDQTPLLILHVAAVPTTATARAPPATIAQLPTAPPTVAAAATAPLQAQSRPDPTPSSTVAAVHVAATCAATRTPPQSRLPVTIASSAVTAAAVPMTVVEASRSVPVSVPSGLRPAHGQASSAQGECDVYVHTNFNDGPDALT